MLSSVGGWRSPLVVVAIGSSFVLCASRARAGAVAPPPSETEPEIAAAGVEGEYLRALHQHIHGRWADGFVATAAHTLPPSDPLNDGTRRAVVLFSIRWDGSLVDASLVAASGAAPYDRAAVDAVRKGSPFGVPPADLISDDGLAHFRWTLARDAHLCSGGELRRHEDPIEETIPRLLGQGRGPEAMLRVGRSLRTTGNDEAMTIYARTWLARPIADPVADAGAAAALAALGDARQAKRLEVALAGAETVAIAAEGLRALKIDVCPLVVARLAPGEARVREIALRALRGAGRREAEPSPSPSLSSSSSASPSLCTAPLTAMVSEAGLAPPLRVMAAEILATMADAEARAALAAATKDAEPAVRAAAILLSARPRGGRPGLYRTIPFVHDPAVEVRAAAAAAMLRCCGDLALPELVLVFKESDPRPALAVADELAHSATEASADFLGRMLKRPDAKVRAAVLAALTARRDPRARAVLAAVARPGGGAGREQPASAASSAASSFQALLAAGRDREAADWIVAEWERLAPRRRAEVLGAWLAKKHEEENAHVSAR